MKKYFKWVMSLLTALVLVVQTVSVNAQANVVDVLTKAHEASKNMTSGQASGYFSVSIDNQGQKADVGQFNFNVKYDLENQVGEANVDVISAFLGGQTVTATAYVKDSVVTLITPEGTKVEQLTDAQVADWNEGYAQFKEALVQSTADVKEEEVSKYYNFNETEAGYVLSLKENIDGRALYAEANKDGLLDQVKERALKQLEERGEVTDETRQMYEKIYSPEFFEFIFASNPKLELTYNKDTYYLDKMTFDFTLDTAGFVNATGAIPAEQAANLPKTVNIKAEVVLTEQGQPQEVTVPEVTEESTEETSEESSSSAE